MAEQHFGKVQIQVQFLVGAPKMLDASASRCYNRYLVRQLANRNVVRCKKTPLLFLKICGNDYNPRAWIC